MAAGKQAMLGQCLSAHILRYIYEARELTSNAVDIWNLTAHLQWHTSSKKATPPIPSLTIPLTGEQAFKYRNLWGPFSFNPPQKLISSGEQLFSQYANVSHLPREKYHGSLNCLDLGEPMTRRCGSRVLLSSSLHGAQTIHFQACAYVPLIWAHSASIFHG